MEAGAATSRRSINHLHMKLNTEDQIVVLQADCTHDYVEY